MQYSVEISELAEKHYDDILDYLANVKMNPQAVHGFARQTDRANKGISERK